jgi:hypothetical protein
MNRPAVLLALVSSLVLAAPAGPLAALPGVAVPTRPLPLTIDVVGRSAAATPRLTSTEALTLLDAARASRLGHLLAGQRAEETRQALDFARWSSPFERAPYALSFSLDWQVQLAGATCLAVGSHHQFPTGSLDQVWLLTLDERGRITGGTLLGERNEQGETDSWTDQVSLQADGAVRLTRQVTWVERVEQLVDDRKPPEPRPATSSNTLTRRGTWRAGALDWSPWSFGTLAGRYLDPKTTERLAVDSAGVWYRAGPRKPELGLRSSNAADGGMDLRARHVELRFPKSPAKVYLVDTTERFDQLLVTNPDGTKQVFTRDPVGLTSLEE